MNSFRQKRTIGAVDVSWGRASDFSQTFRWSSGFEEQEINIEQNAFKLPYFAACLFATILEDIITQLYILDECNSELRMNKVMIEMSFLLAHKYGVEQKHNKDELDEIDHNNLGCVEHKLKKLQSDRYFIIQVLKDTYLNLSINRHFEALNENVNSILNTQAHLNKLIEEESKNKILRRELNRQLRQQRNRVKSATYDTNHEIERLKSHLENVDLNSEIRSRYIDSWQRARSEQHIWTMYNKEIIPSQIIEDFKRKIDQEQRVHTEIELLTNIKISEVLTKVEQWMSKYEKDIEHMDLKIQLKKNEYEHECEKRLELEETIAKHAELINNWVSYKEEREAERQYQEDMNNAAVTVQAWWRGLLVRQQLGPYKVVKRKEPVPKPEEKSGKKKK